MKIVTKPSRPLDTDTRSAVFEQYMEIVEEKQRSLSIGTEKLAKRSFSNYYVFKAYKSRTKVPSIEKMLLIMCAVGMSRAMAEEMLSELLDTMPWKR